MGAVCSAASLACCCGSAACSLCNCCPSCKNSVATRIMYGIMLLLGAIAAAITLAPGLQSKLSKVPFCENSTSTSSVIIPADISIDCQAATGYLAVYRICFAFTCFFVLMSVLMIGVRTSRDPRQGIQNGFWGIKYLIVIGGCIGAFFIPAASEFGNVWMVFGMIGGLLFILIQLVLIVDFAHSWAERWVRNYEENENKIWYVLLLFATFICYAIAITGVVLLYVYFTKADDCALNKFFISLNLILCVILSIISILPTVQEHQPRSGLLQSAVVSLYVIYLTWSAASNSPDTECNPGFLLNKQGDATKVVFDKESVIALVLWMLVVMYSSLKSASSSERMISSDSENVIVGNEDSNDDKDDENTAVTYNWSFFHIVFALAMLYIMMTLTNWYSPNSTLDTLNSNAASMWVKIISSWLCVVLYTWTLVAPMVFPNRDFSM